jgi:hypothetical protein
MKEEKQTGIFLVSKEHPMPCWLGILGLLIGLLILIVQLAGLAKQEPSKTIKTNGTAITSPQLLNE